MNWIKLEDKSPEFGKLVLLFGEKDGVGFADCGSLTSIDKEGMHWDFGTLMDMFGCSVLVPNRSNRKFEPTYWCEIIPPIKQ